MRPIIILLFFLGLNNTNFAQLHWQIVDSLQSNLPKGLTVFYSNDSIEGKPNIAYYAKADLKNKQLIFDVDTTKGRRLTPQEFYNKNYSPIIVVNGTFFSAKTNQNLNTVIKNGRALAFNTATAKGRGNDSAQILKMYRSAIGITKKRKADIAWVNSDTTKRAMVSQIPITAFVKNKNSNPIRFKKWKVKTAIGGGPVLIQNSQIMITNNEELLFEGKAKYDKHPRTAMGYTADGYLIILVVEGRNAGVAEGANLQQLATMLKDIGCVEALNLDGGGSSCMLVNGKQTIKPSDKTEQRQVPAVLMIKTKHKTFSNY